MGKGRTFRYILIEAPSVRLSDPLRAFPSIARRVTIFGFCGVDVEAEYAIEGGGVEVRECREDEEGIWSMFSGIALAIEAC